MGTSRNPTNISPLNIKMVSPIFRHTQIHLSWVFHPSCWSLDRHVSWSNPIEKLWHYHILRSNHPLTSYFRVPSGYRAFDPPEKSLAFCRAGATLRGRVELAAESSGCHEALWSSRGSSGEKIPSWFFDWTDKMLDFLLAIKFSANDFQFCKDCYGSCGSFRSMLKKVCENLPWVTSE